MALNKYGLRLSIAAIVSAMSCSTFVQPSVHSASVDCSPSRAYYITDLVIATGTAIAASMVPQPKAEFYIPTGVFGLSSVLGIYKRNNCVRWRKEAPPEEWTRVAEANRRAAEARAAADAQAAAQAQADAQAQAAMQAAAPVCQAGLSYNASTGLCEDPNAYAPSVGPTQSAPAPTQSTFTGTWNSNTTNTTNTTRNTTYVRPPPEDPHVRNPAFHAVFSRVAKGPTSCQTFDDRTPNSGANLTACSNWCLPYLTAHLTCNCESNACR